ncbi:MAG: exosortase-associated EpsI family protein [Methanomicrobia archaeon]|nr:exosortase-associated EpsI family protein [Methanomicrobia archaeon]
MQQFFEDYSKIIGLLMLAFVIIILFSTPSMILAKSVTTIGTELSHATGDELRVRTRMDFGNNEHMRAFPKQIDDWTASDYETTGITESLNADVILMRAYSHPKIYQPVFFLILQSTNRSSFHPPIVCYPALGYTIEEEGNELILVQNVSWAEDPWLSEKNVTRNVALSIKKLVVVKEAEDDGKITERRVVLYYYVKDRPFTSDTVTMIRVSTLAPIEGSYEGVLNISKEFMGDTVPCMFEVQRAEPTLFTSLASGSAIQKGVLVMLFLAPLAVIFYPELRAMSYRRLRK